MVGAGFSWLFLHNVFTLVGVLHAREVETKLSQTSFSGCTMVSGPFLDGKTLTCLVVGPSRWDVFLWNLGMRWNKGLFFPWWTYPDSLSLGPPGNRHTPFHYFFRYPREFDVQVFGSLSLDLLRSRLLYPSSCPFPSARGRGVLRSRSKDVLYGDAFIISCLVFAHDKPCHLLISCFPGIAYWLHLQCACCAWRPTSCVSGPVRVGIFPDRLG